MKIEELKDTEYDLSKLRGLTLEADTRYAEFRKAMSELISVNYKERALQKAKEMTGEECRIIGIGVNDKFILISMSNDKLDGKNDGLSFPQYAVNKETGEEVEGTILGIMDTPGFEDLVPSELSFLSNQ